MTAQNDGAPATANRRGADKTILAGLRQHHSEPLSRLLSRLENVRPYGQGFRAACPAHDSKSKSSLSIAVGGDGRVLIHCFAGCAPLDILHAAGLDLSDLFPERLTHNPTPAQRRELRELARQSQWKAAIPTLCSEALVVLMASLKVGRGEHLSTEDDSRLVLAIERIETAKDVFCGR